jgi:hypothetical protein
MDEAIKNAVSRWLIKAEHDLTTAQTMLSVDPPITDTACFDHPGLRIPAHRI